MVASPSTTGGLPRSLFAIIQGRFVEALVTHFFKKSAVVVTAYKDGSDGDVTEGA